MTFSRKLFSTLALGVGLSLPGAFAQAPAAAKDAPKSSKPPAQPAPSAAEIADAKSKGMVWVNLNTKVYHKQGDFYGKTKSGKFMAEADAQKGGYRAAQEPVAKKKKSDATNKPQASKK